MSSHSPEVQSAPGERGADRVGNHSADVLAVIEVRGDYETSPNEALHHILRRMHEAGEILSWVVGEDAIDPADECRAAWQRAQSAPVVPEGYVLVPVAATAENGAKAALLGEFTIQHQATCSGCYYDEADEDCEVCGGEVHYTEHVTVPWDTIKEIYAEAVRVLSAAPAQPAARHDQGDEVLRLREALEPFAAIADAYDPAEDDDHRVWIDAQSIEHVRLPLRAFRAARAALSASAEGK